MSQPLDRLLENGEEEEEEVVVSVIALVCNTNCLEENSKIQIDVSP
jgi:hypothetical protein